MTIYYSNLKFYLYVSTPVFEVQQQINNSVEGWPWNLTFNDVLGAHNINIWKFVNI